MSINTTGARPDSSAMLDVSSTTQGILIPRMTIAQRNAISNPAQGLLIFQTDANTGIWVYDTAGTGWEILSTNVSTQGIDSVLNIGNNASGDSIVNLGSLGVGTLTPLSELTVHSQTGWPELSLSSGITSGAIFSYVTFHSSVYSGTTNRSNAIWQMGFKQEASTSSAADRWYVGRAGVSSQDLLVDRQGWVGVGELFPTERLDVAGNARVDSLVVHDGSNSPSAGDVLTAVDATGRAYWVAPIGDNLGDHSAAQNIELNGFRLSNDGDNEGLTVSNSGMVTATPATTGAGNVAFYANGDFRTSGNGTGIYFTNTAIGITGNNSNSGDMRFRTGSTDRIRIFAAGGITMYEPASGYTLSLFGKARLDTLNINSAYTLPSADGSNGQVLQTDGSGNVSWAAPSGAGQWTSNGNDLYTTFDSVGIGTNNPKYPLHITSNSTPQVRISPASNTGNDAALILAGARNASTSTQHAQIRLQNYDNDLVSTNDLGRITGEVTNASTNVGDMVFYNYTDGSTASETMRLTRTGRVGIGTSSPVSSVQVSGGVRSDSTVTHGVYHRGYESINYMRFLGNNDVQIRSSSFASIGASDNIHLKVPSNTTMLSVTDSGVGIGEISPDAMMHIQGDLLLDRNGSNNVTRTLTIQGAGPLGSNVYGRIDFNGYDNSSGSFEYTGASITARNLGSSNHGAMGLWTYDGTTLYERVRITRTGEVHIDPDNAGGSRLYVRGVTDLDDNLNVSDSVSVTGNITVNNGQTATPSNGNYGGNGTRLILWPGSSTNTPYAFGINSSTLWYSVPTAAVHRWYHGTAENMSLSSTGLGLGVSSPQDVLHINGDVRFEEDNNVLIYVEDQTSNDAGNHINIEAADGGSGGVGVSGGNVTLRAGDGYNAGGAGSGGEINLIAGGNTLGNNSHGDIVMMTRDQTTNVERLRIDGTNGFVGIGTNAPSHLLHVNGVARSTSATWAVTSDARAKQNVHTIENASETLIKFRPVTYEWKPEFKTRFNDQKPFRYGFISQEAEQVIPHMVYETTEVVNGDTISDFKVLDQEPLIPLLVRAFQEQQAEIDSLRAQVDAVRRDNEILHSELDKAGLDRSTSNATSEKKTLTHNTSHP